MPTIETPTNPKLEKLLYLKTHFWLGCNKSRLKKHYTHTTALFKMTLIIIYTGDIPHNIFEYLRTEACFHGDLRCAEIGGDLKKEKQETHSKRNGADKPCDLQDIAL